MSAKLAIPTVLAVFAVVFAMKAGGIASGPQPANAEAAQPTPYSADHARIADGDGSAQEPAPTF